MTVLFIILFSLLAIAAVAKAIRDVLDFSFSASVFYKYAGNRWIDPNLSWHNKWNYKSQFIRLIFSTILVFTTDLSHFSQHIYLMCLFASMIPLGFVFTWWLPIVMYAAFTVMFQIAYWAFKLR